LPGRRFRRSRHRPEAARRRACPPSSGGLYQDAAHGLGRGGEEVPAAVPAGTGLGADQPEIRLVNQGGGLEGVVGPLPGHAGGGELPQLVVHEREQVGRGLVVAGRGRVEKSRHKGHSAEFTDSGRDQNMNLINEPIF